MKRKSSFIALVHLALLGSILLAGCPGGGHEAARTVVAGLNSNPEEVQNTCSTPANADVLIEQVAQLVNAERTNRGLDAIELNDVLIQMAHDYCCEMIEQGFFDHEHPMTGEGPGSRAYRAVYVFLAVGENLAAGQETAEQVVAEWMSSPEHKEIILGVQWREMGVGVRTGGDYNVYWVLEFGNPP